jgi:hypothetical protein
MRADWARGLAAAAAVSALVGLAGCGGGGNSPTVVPTPTPVPTPPPPVVVSQIQGFSLRANFVSFANFSVPSTGTVEAIVDWTFPANDLDVYLTTATCTFTQLQANQCSTLGFSESFTAKPERVKVTNVAAGNYMLWVANAGPGDESLSYQIVFSANAGGGPGAVSVSAPEAPSFEKGRPRGVVEAR